MTQKILESERAEKNSVSKNIEKILKQKKKKKEKKKVKKKWKNNPIQSRHDTFSFSTLLQYPKIFRMKKIPTFKNIIVPPNTIQHFPTRCNIDQIIQRKQFPTSRFPPTGLLVATASYSQFPPRRPPKWITKKLMNLSN